MNTLLSESRRSIVRWRGPSDEAHAETASGCYVEPVARSEATRARLWECLHEHGAWAGQTQVLSKDPWSVLWRSRSRKAYLPFLERRFLILGWRDPVGAADQHAALLQGILDYARRRAKSVCILGASTQLAELARPMGLGAVWMGQEQEFALPSFHLRG
jgi:hypothetical protein